MEKLCASSWVTTKPRQEKSCSNCGFQDIRGDFVLSVSDLSFEWSFVVVCDKN